MQPQVRNFLNLQDIEESTLKYQIWKSLNNNPQLFYSEKWNKFFVNNYTYIYMFDKDECIKYDLHLKIALQALVYNDQSKMLAWMTVEGNINIYWLKNNTQTIIRPSKERCSIIYFDFLYNSKGFIDFFIVETLGIRVFKIEDQKKSIKEVKQISIRVSGCWFQCKSEVLACCNNLQNGAIHFFHFVEKRAKNNYRGVSLALDFEDANQSKQEGALDFLIKKSKIGNKEQKFKVESTLSNKPLFGKYQNQQYFIKLLNIYDKPTLIFFNTLEGRLKIYQLLQDQIIKSNLNIKLPSDGVAYFNVYDNLLIAHLKFDKISFIFDIKRQSSQPIVTPLPLLWDLMDHQNTYDSVFLNKWVVHPSKVIKKWSIQLTDVFTYNKNEQQVFLFLMRRKNSKMIILKWIRENLYKFKVTLLSTFWKHMFDEYEIAYKQQDKFKLDRAISPVDVYANVFYTLSEDQNVEKEKLCDIILECVRQMLEFKLQVPSNLQNLIFKLLQLKKKYLFIAQLIQNKILDDTKQLALRIFEESLNLDQNDAEIFQQLTIDILYRKQHYKQLIQIFLKLNLLYQATRVMRKHWVKLQPQDLISVGKNIQNIENKKKYKQYLKDFIRQYRPGMNQEFFNRQLQNQLVI